MSDLVQASFALAKQAALAHPGKSSITAFTSLSTTES